MRIFKLTNVDEDVLRIACEMFNIEAGGEILNPKGEIRPKSSWDLSGYPRFKRRDQDFRIKATEGYVYVGVGSSIRVHDLEKRLEHQLETLEETVREAGVIPADHLGDYQTARVSVHTNIKVKNQNALTVGSRGSAKQNVRRRFTEEQETAINGNTTRFTWHLFTIDKFNFTLDNSMRNTVSRYVSSVFYDTDGISRFSDGAFTIDFSRKDLVGWEHVLANQEIILSKYYNPIAFEVSEYWQTRMPASDNVLEVHRNVSPNKIYAGDFSTVKLKPVETANGEYRDDACSRCFQSLYGDFYVMMIPVKQPDFERGTAVCPLCLHLLEKPLEKKYLHVLRVTHSRSLTDVVKSLDVTDERKQLLLAAARGFTTESLSTNDDDYRYFVVGDEYLVFNDLDHYLFSKLSTVNNKKVLLLHQRVRDESSWVLDV